jgi:hypothetical protein
MAIISESVTRALYRSVAGAGEWYLITVKVKQIYYRPGQALRFPGVSGSQILRQSAQEDSKVVTPTHRPPLPPRNYYWYSFLLEAESTPGP